MNPKSYVKSLNILYIVVAIPGLLMAPAHAEETFTAFRENDGPSIKGTDRHYTNGVKLVYTFNPDWNWLESWGKWNMPDRYNPATAVGFFGGQSIYTPDHIDKPESRRQEDMRYSGHLFGGMFVQKATSEEFEQMEINLGVIGPSSRAEDIQKWWHHTFGYPKPKGWDEQIKDEFAFDFSWEQKRKYQGWAIMDKWDTDWIIHYGLTAGSIHRHLNAGATWRLGIDLPGDFGPGRINDYQDVTRKNFVPQKRTYLFVRGDGWFVDHNRFYSQLDIEPVVGQLQVGLVFLWSRFEMSISQTAKTHEFKRQPSFDAFAGVSFTYRF
jgi:lipid A 3-O-deacylase